MDSDDKEDDWVGFNHESSRSGSNTSAENDHEAQESVESPPTDDFGLSDVPEPTQDADPSEPNIKRELRSALDYLKQAKSGNDSRDDLIRAHNHLCRALDLFDFTKTDIQKGKIETAITEIEGRLEQDTNASVGTASSTSGSDTQEGEANEQPSPSHSEGSADTDSDPEASTPDRAELIAELRRLSDEQEGVVSRGSMWSMGSFDPGDYEDVFGSWEAALEKSGLLGGAEPASEPQTGNGSASSAEDVPQSLDRPEGRISSLEVIVKDIEEIEDTARDRELNVETAEGISLPLLIWDEHEVDYEFETDGRYLLTQTLYETWETNSGIEPQLNSTSDLEITELGAQDWLSSVRLELHRYRIEQEDDILRLDDVYRFCEHRLANKFPDNNNIRPKIRQILQRLRERGEVQFVNGEGTYRIIGLDGFPEARDKDSDRGQATDTGHEGRVETDSKKNKLDTDRSGESSKPGAESDASSEPGQIDRFMDDLDL